MGTQRKKTKYNKHESGRPVQGKKKPDKKDKGFSPGKKKKLIELVNTLAEPLCEAEGIELVHVEYQSEGRGMILRLYIDKPDINKAGGVTLDDCVFISRQLSDILDVSIDQDFSYNLEVSSPGIDRPLGKESDYEKFKGQTVMIKTSQAVEGRKKFQGILKGISDSKVIVLVNDKTFLIPYDMINRARLVNNNGENRC